MKSCFFTSYKRKRVEAIGNDLVDGISKELFNYENQAGKVLIKKFIDGATPVAYKEGNVNGQKGNNVIHRIIAKRYKENNSIYINEVSQNEYNGLSLVKKNNQWYIYDYQTKNYFKPDSYRKYVFVTMPDKTIRVALDGSSSSVHSLLANNAPYVRYAGEVVFDENQRIHSWNNQSGSYCPPPVLAFQAEFNDGIARFVAKYDRNDPDKQLEQTFTKHFSSRITLA